MARALHRGPAGALAALVRDRGPAGALVRVVAVEPGDEGGGGVPNVVALFLPGDPDDNPISTPQPAGLPTDSLDLRFKGTIEASSVTNQTFLDTAGTLPIRFAVTWNQLMRLTWRHAGGWKQSNATVAHTVPYGTTATWRTVLRSDGGTGHEVLFYTSTDWNPATDSGTWTQVGATVTGTEAVALNIGTSSAVHLGGLATNTTENLGTKLQYASIRPNGGAEVVSFNATAVASTGPQAPASYTDPHGNVWSISGATWAWVTA